MEERELRNPIMRGDEFMEVNETEAEEFDDPVIASKKLHCMFPSLCSLSSEQIHSICGLHFQLRRKCLKCELTVLAKIGSFRGVYVPACIGIIGPTLFLKMAYVLAKARVFFPESLTLHRVVSF
jgi:hypothetical protein